MAKDRDMFLIVPSPLPYRPLTPLPDSWVMNILGTVYCIRPKGELRIWLVVSKELWLGLFNALAGVPDLEVQDVPRLAPLISLGFSLTFLVHATAFARSQLFFSLAAQTHPILKGSSHMRPYRPFHHKQETKSSVVSSIPSSAYSVANPKHFYQLQGQEERVEGTRP